MKEFSFTQSGEGQGARTDISRGNIHLNRSSLTIGRDVYQNLGKPARLVVEHDVVAKAIRLTPAPHALAGYSVQLRTDTKTGRASVRVTKPQQFLPIGEYVPISNNIFVHESVQR